MLLSERNLAVSHFQAQTTAILDEAGRRIEARRGRDVETLRSPAIERLSRKQAEGLSGRIDLTDAEVERLAEILDRGFSPTPALREVLSRLADPKRQPPRLHWKETVA